MRVSYTFSLVQHCPNYKALYEVKKPAAEISRRLKILT